LTRIIVSSTDRIISEWEEFTRAISDEEQRSGGEKAARRVWPGAHSEPHPRSSHHVSIDLAENELVHIQWASEGKKAARRVWPGAHSEPHPRSSHHVSIDLAEKGLVHYTEGQ